MDKKGSRKPLARSFSHAWAGIRDTLRSERNMKIHCAVALLVIIFGFFLHVSAMEWCLLSLSIGIVAGLELMNTAVEAAVDLVTEEYAPLAKKAKDASAGAVLTAAAAAAVTGGIIFFPKLWNIFSGML